MNHALRHKCTVQTATAVDDGRGGQAVTWANTLTNVPCQFDPRSGREFYQAGAVQASPTYQVRVAYSSSITVKTRVYRAPSGPTYEVVQVIPVGRGDSYRYLDLDVIEVDS
jgi:SPP1 family predicted phage head-tail adaptor